MITDNSNQKVVEDFQKSFVGCMNCMRSGDNVRTAEAKEMKTDAEIAAQRFMETAHLAEMDFNKKYVLFACYCPEELLKQEILEMKKEIERKDTLIKQYKDKLNHWQQVLRPNIISNSSNAPSLPGFAPIQRQQQQQSSSNELN